MDATEWFVLHSKQSAPGALPSGEQAGLWNRRAARLALPRSGGKNLQITYNWFFTPESLRHLVETSGLEIVETYVDPNTNTGNGIEICWVVRMLCRAR